MKHPSLAGALYLRIMLLLALTGTAMAITLYIVAEKEVRYAADHQLENASHLLYMLMREELSKKSGASQVDLASSILSTEDREAFRTNPDWGTFAVFRHGTLVAQSRKEPDARPAPQLPGFHDYPAPDGLWRSYGLAVPEYDLLIVVAEPYTNRNFTLAPVTRRLALPLFGMMLVGASLLWFALSRGLSEVRRLSQDLGERRFTDLTQLDAKEWPRDIAPLIHSLNKLFGRLEQAFELEQAFTDDLAHQIRTPLAAIRAQAQLIQKLAHEELRTEIDQLLFAVDRVNDLVNGLLMLARLDATALNRVPTDITQLVSYVVAEQVLQRPTLDVAFSLTPEAPVTFPTDSAVLEIILTTVIENAVLHANGETIDIVINEHPRALAITVTDDGPGIPAHEQKRLLQRFERGSSGAPGSGLGLSIAARAIAILEGSLLLGDRPDGSGLAVSIVIPNKI